MGSNLRCVESLLKKGSGCESWGEERKRSHCMSVCRLLV